MYREHFGLTMNPFGISPRLDFVYASSAFAESRAHLVYGLESNEAIVMITGAIGTGKTMTVQSFLAQLGERHLTALVTNTSVDARELLKLILDDLGVSVPRESDKSDLLIALKQLVIDEGREGRRVIVIIDEAQNLAPGVLEEIRLLTNLGQGDQQPVAVILVGQPELENIVARPELAQLRQRIRVHYRLVPLTRKELGEYVDHRMVVAGGRVGTFTGGALDRVFALSAGVPRVVNTLCNDALLAAFVAGHGKVEAQDVEASDGMPTPIAVTPATAAVEPAREPVVEPVAAPRMATRRATTDAGEAREDRHDSRSRRGPLLVAVMVVLAVAAVLALTGQLDRFRHRSAAPDVNLAFTERPESPAVARRDSVIPAVADSFHAGAATGSGLLGAAATPDSASNRPAATTAAVTTDKVPASASPVSKAAEVAAAPKSAAVAAGESGGQVTEMATGPWYIHVCSFQTTEQAAEKASKYAAMGHESMVREQVVNNATWYRVYLGPFEVRKTAVSLAEQMRADGSITYYQVQRLAPVTAP